MVGPEQDSSRLSPLKCLNLRVSLLNHVFTSTPDRFYDLATSPPAARVHRLE